MKITRFRVRKVTGTLSTDGPMWEERLVRPIDIYPEYTGTAITTVLKLPSSRDAARVLGAVRSEYQKRWKVEWLRPFGFNNSFAMVIRGDDARRNHFEILSDAARRKTDWVLGIGYEFLQRPVSWSVS